MHAATSFAMHHDGSSSRNVDGKMDWAEGGAQVLAEDEGVVVVPEGTPDSLPNGRAPESGYHKPTPSLSRHLRGRKHKDGYR